MNQILYTQKNKKNGNKIQVKNVVIFFVIAIIIFGLAFIAQGTYAVITAKKQQQEEEKKIPNITLQRNDEELEFIVENEKPIYTIAYNWNGGEETKIDAEATTKFQTTIDLPIGTNTLNITVTDVNQRQYNYQKEYVVEGVGKPEVELSVTNQNQIKIIAKDSYGLQSIIYTWNNGEEKIVKPTSDDDTLIEALIDIPLGQNTLNVVATNYSNLQTTKTLDVKGVRKPKVTITKEGNGLHIKVEDEQGIKEINYTLNGNRYTINSAYFGTKNKVVEYTQPLEQGENTIILEAYNINDEVTEYKGKCMYP